MRLEAVYQDPVAQAQDIRATCLTENAFRVATNRVMEAVELERELGHDRWADYWLAVLDAM